jgi:glutamate racemase
MATRATIASAAYDHAIKQLDPAVEVFSAACPLLVPLIEEGLFEDPVTDQILARYLAPLLEKNVDTIVLGCTHYPLLRATIARAVGPDITLVDSANNCALAVKNLLLGEGMSAPLERLGRLDVALTDSTEGFLRVAQKALGIEIGEVQLRAVQTGE